jgi:hypothetical protein
VKTRAERVGLDPASFAGHSLRAGFLTSAAKGGVNIFKMMDVSGHRSVDTLRDTFATPSYFRITPGPAVVAPADGYCSETQGLPPRYADRGSADESRERGCRGAHRRADAARLWMLTQRGYGLYSGYGYPAYSSYYILGTSYAAPYGIYSSSYAIAYERLRSGYAAPYGPIFY